DRGTLFCAKSCEALRRLRDGAERGQNFLRMPFRADLAPDAHNAPLRGDQERRAFDTHKRSSVHSLFDPDAIGVDHGLLLIGGKAKVELVLAFEVVMAPWAVGRNSYDGRAGPLEPAGQSAELLCLDGAPFGVVLRVEIKHHKLAAKGLEAQVLS